MSTPRFFTDEQEQEIIAEYKKLGSCWKTGEVFKCSHSLVWSILKKNGVVVQKPKHFYSFTKEQEWQMVELYGKGVSCEEIGSIFKCSEKMVYRVIRRNNVII